MKQNNEIISGITTRIKSLSPDFTKAETKVAQYIMQHSEEVPFLSVYEVSSAVDVSVASVSRFVRRIGFSNFKDFKVELAKDSGTQVPDIYRAITPGDNNEEIVKKVFRGYVHSIEETLKILDVKNLIQVARILCRAGRVVLFGIGGSGIVAQDAALRLSHLDLQAEAYTDPLYIIIQARRMKKGDVVVGVSHSGRTRITCEAVRLAGQKGAITCGITNYMKAPLSNYTRYLFCTSFPEDKVKVAALSSRIAQLCIIDALYLLTAKNKDILWDTESLNRLTEQLLRLD